MSEVQTNLAGIKATLDLVLKRLEVVDRFSEGQIELKVLVGEASKERNAMWKKIQEMEKRLQKVDTLSAINEQNNKATRTVMTLTPGWIAAGVSLVLAVAGLVYKFK